MKKGKLLAVFAALSLTVGVSAGVLAGCGGHVHDYSEWDSNETQHWKYCPEDDEIDEESRAEHGAPNAEGKCPDCGYVLHTHTFTEWGSNATQHWKKCPTDGEIDQSTKTNHGAPDEDGKCPDCKYQLVTYVDQSGTLSLRKGQDVTKVASFDGVTVTLKHGEKTLTEGTDYTLETGEDGAFTIKKIAKATYTLIVEKEGYYTHSQSVEINGTANLNVTLDYKLMEMMPSYYPNNNPPVNGDLDAEFHDFSHVNDENPYIALIGENRVLNAKTTESYGNFVATFTAQLDKSWHPSKQQGFMLFFEGGKVQGFVLQYEENQEGAATKTEIELNGGDICGIGTTNDERVFGGDWSGYRTWTNEEIAAFKSAKGMQVSLARVGDKLYILVNGVQRWWYQLPDEVKDEACSIGFWMNGASTNLRFDYSVTDDVSVPISVTSNENGTVTANKQSAKLGETVTLTLKPKEVSSGDGYVLSSLTVNGKDITDRVSDPLSECTLQLPVEFLMCEIVAEFKQIERIASYTVEVEGRLLGGKTLPDGLTVTLSGMGETKTATLTDGVATFTNLIPGKYTATVSGKGNEYLTVTDFEADESIASPTLVFDDTVTLYQGDGRVDLSHVNDAQGYLTVNSFGHLIAESKQSFDKVVFTTTLRKTMANEGKLGILVNFSNGKGFLVGTENFEGRSKLIVRAEWFGSASGNATGWIEDLTDCKPMNDEFWGKFNSETGLTVTVIRDGKTIRIIVENRLVKTLDLGEDYAALTCTVGVYAEDATANSRFDYVVSEATGSIVIDALQNGTVTADKTAYTDAEEVTLTITPASGYMLDTLIVDGHDLTARLNNLVNGGTVTVYPTGKTLNVSATFVTYETIASYTAAAKSQKWGVKAAFAENTEVTLSGKYGTYMGTVGADGNVTFTNVIAGSYTVSVDGYFSQTVTVEDGATNIEWTLIANNMVDQYGERTGIDFTHVHDENGYILAGKAANGGVFESTDMLTDVTMTTYLHYNWNGDENADHFQGLLLNFSNNKGVKIGTWANGETMNLAAFNSTWGVGDPSGALAENQIVALTDAQKAAWKSADGLKLTVMRKANVIKVYLADELVITVTLDESYASLECKVGFAGLWLYENCNIPFIVRVEVPADFNGQE